MSKVNSVRTLGSYELEAKYSRVSRLGDNLQELSALVDWNAFRNVLEKAHSETQGPGMPSYDCILLFKMLLLQAWHRLPDEQLEYQVADRFSFQKFLDFPETIPDHSTIWGFGEALTKHVSQGRLLEMLNEQLDAKGFKIRKGVIQDATIISADAGKKRLAELKNKSNEGKGVSYSPNQLAHMDLDTSSTMKNGQYE